MLAYHDASMGFGAIQSDDTSPYDSNRRYSNRNRQHEINPLETSKSQRCLRKTTQILFSHIGLVGLVVVYAVAGAFLFQLLEERQEKLLCQIAQGEQVIELNKLRQKLVKYIQYNTTSFTDLSYDKDNTTIALQKIGYMLYQYRDFVINATSKRQYFRDDCSYTHQWTYANSLLFAITVITTIGYGNIAPITSEGQLCCICYATIGIPIFLLCLANISGVLGEMFRFLYAKVLCAPCSIVRKRRTLAKKAQLQEETGLGTEHVYCSPYALDDKKTKNSSNTAKNSDQLDDDLEEKDARVNVPLTVTMIIIAAYIWIGSALFHSFEDWSMMQSGYFCFITLATIGFGDFVPGQGAQDANANGKLVLGAIYVLFGMAILAMCFDLMQEEIVAKFRWIGTKIGIIDQEDENKNSMSKVVNTKRKSCSSGTLSVNDPNIIMHTNRTIVENENEYDLPIENTNSVTIRKTSPRNNQTRVHPMFSNEATLHQRVTTTKLN